ncbi:c5a12611-8c66-427a-80e9-ed35e016708b [Thermothielavioides terrestris]|uniref:NmrA-like domain-containing protein n=2 Tax=Thermothielavioides terrestris TaxID=2587410 RepID=G2QVN1_THETT|nr:uncharacterized protein THITE_2084517 [Thermothielavioides terrestris NRRL 8126]AEO63012.1 hypothetical protein THITE_2084517 [Thermothielavioides terrestris NRRL 8126]SPQ21496.1 c5a12611-8c66-427a-80e9-ed35e016708b [Thermothielavioides terrestris]
MVKIAIAGGSGDLGREILDALVATGKHEILILSRNDTPTFALAPGVTWVKANYDDANQLAEILRGVDTVISVIVVHTDPDNRAQKNLIDAAVRAGVRRLAPSEWITSTVLPHMPWYAGKVEIRKYLEDINKDKKVLEYTLFQPGLFLNYLTYPHKSAKHIVQLELPISFAHRRALMVEGSDEAKITLTTAEDLANVVARAVEYEGEWPRVGGVRGTELTLGQLLAIGERVRGAPFHIERLDAEDLKAGKIKSSWMPMPEHHAISPEELEKLRPTFIGGMILGISAGHLSVSDEWNRLLPDYKFTQAEEFLAAAWRGKLDEMGL